MAKAKKYVTTAVVRDADKYVKPGETKQTYAIGTDVSHFSKERIEYLLSKNAVEEETGDDK